MRAHAARADAPRERAARRCAFAARRKCLDLAWDKDGETIAILQQGSPIIKLWDVNQSIEHTVDTGMQDLTCMRWGTSGAPPPCPLAARLPPHRRAHTLHLSGPYLAVGTAKGNLLIYNKRTLKKTNVANKHTKRITSGAWSRDNMLVLAGEDRQVTPPPPITSHL